MKTILATALVSLVVLQVLVLGVVAWQLHLSADWERKSDKVAQDWNALIYGELVRANEAFYEGGVQKVQIEGTVPIKGRVTVASIQGPVQVHGDRSCYGIGGSFMHFFKTDECYPVPVSVTAWEAD